MKVVLFACTFSESIKVKCSLNAFLSSSSFQYAKYLSLPLGSFSSFSPLPSFMHMYSRPLYLRILLSFFIILPIFCFGMCSNEVTAQIPLNVLSLNSSFSMSIFFAFIPFSLHSFIISFDRSIAVTSNPFCLKYRAWSPEPHPRSSIFLPCMREMNLWNSGRSSRFVRFLNLWEKSFAYLS